MADTTRDPSVTVDLDQLIRLKADARGFSFLPGQPVHSLLAGRHTSRLRGRGLTFEELRQYSQGDDVRTIDWKATARLRSPHVRVYSEERERPVLLLVDQRSPMFFGSRRAMKSVVAAQLAALAAWRTLLSGDRIGGVVLGNQEIVNLRPQRSQTAVLRLLHEVVRLNHRLMDEVTAPTITLNQGLEAVARRAFHDHLVVIISDLDGADDDTKRIATQLAAHNDVLVVAVYDPLGASLKNYAGMLASTSDGPCLIPGDGGFPQAFQKTFTDLLQRWQQTFQALQVPVLPISTAEPAADQLRELFGNHAP